MQPVIPQLFSPFRPAINEHVTDIAARTAAWVHRFGLHSGAGAFQKYQQEALSWMTARFYPRAQMERLAVVDRFNTLLFAMDDLMDHNIEQAEVIKSRPSFQAFVAACLQIMAHQPPDLPVTGHLAALQDVWQEVCAVTDPSWQRRFTDGIFKMFEAALWAHDNVAAGRMPTAAAFYTMRPYLGAANTSTDMISMVNALPLDAEILADPHVAELTRLCQITVCLANDLFSLSKEVAHSDYHNMVQILQQQNNLSQPEAIAATVRMHDRDVTAFIALKNKVLHNHQYGQSLPEYIRALEELMRGNIDWSVAETGRYQFQYGIPAATAAYTALPGRCSLFIPGLWLPAEMPQFWRD